MMRYWDWKLSLGNVPQSIDVYHDMTFRTFWTIIGLVMEGDSAAGLNSLPTTYAAASGLAVTGVTTRVAYRVAYTLVTTGTTVGDKPAGYAPPLLLDASPAGVTGD